MFVAGGLAMGEIGMETDPIMADRFEKLVLLLSLFEKHSIEYVLVGESPKQLRQTIPSDVDIVVSWEGNKKLPSVFRELRDRYGVELVHVYRHEIGVFGALLAWRHADSWNRLGPDICSDYYREGHLLLKSEELLFGRRRDTSTGFWMPRPELNFAYYMIKKIGKGNLTDAQIRFLHDRLMESSVETNRTILSRWFLPDEVDTIFTSISEMDTSALRRNMAKFQKTLWQRTRPRVSMRLRDVYRKVSRLSTPCGIIAIIRVPDCAQDTICDAWMTNVRPFFRHASVFSTSSNLSLSFFGVLRAKWHSHAVLILVSEKTSAICTLVLRAISDLENTFVSDFKNSAVSCKLLESVILHLSRRTVRRFGWKSKEGVFQ